MAEWYAPFFSVVGHLLGVVVRLRSSAGILVSAVLPTAHLRGARHIRTYPCYTLGSGPSAKPLSPQGHAAKGTWKVLEIFFFEFSSDLILWFRIFIGFILKLWVIEIEEFWYLKFFLNVKDNVYILIGFYVFSIRLVFNYNII